MVEGGEERRSDSMVGERRFKSWNIFDSGLNKAAAGHHYWETKGLVDELVRRGETVRLFSHANAPPAELFPGVPLVPAFSQYLYKNFSNDRSWQTLENFILHSWFFSQDLAKLDSSLFQESLVLFPTVGPGQLLGLIRWLGSFAPGNRPKAAISLMAPLDSSKTSHSIGLYKTVWKDCPSELRKRIALFCRTPQTAELFATQAGIPAQVFPIVMPQDLAVPSLSPGGAQGDAMVVSFVGGSRRERGVELIPDVVARCKETGVQFFIQARDGEDSGFDIGRLTALSGLPHVQVQEGPLERKDYYRVIANSVSLLAYQPNRYGWRASGVYTEARFLGAPVLVSAGTWMADEVAALGNGLVIKEHSADAIVDCIAQAQYQLPALKAAAARVGKTMREQHGVARCIDAVAGAFETPGGA